MEGLFQSLSTTGLSITQHHRPNNPVSIGAHAHGYTHSWPITGSWQMQLYTTSIMNQLLHEHTHSHTYTCTHSRHLCTQRGNISRHPWRVPVACVVKIYMTGWQTDSGTVCHPAHPTALTLTVLLLRPCDMYAPVCTCEAACSLLTELSGRNLLPIWLCFS